MVLKNKQLILEILHLQLIFFCTQNQKHVFQLSLAGLCGNRAEHISVHSNHQGKVSRRNPTWPNMSPQHSIQPSKWFRALYRGSVPDHSVQLHSLLLLANSTLCSKIWSKTLRNRKVQAQLQLIEHYNILRISQLFLPKLQLLVQGNHTKVQHNCPICCPVLLQRLLHGVVFHRSLLDLRK